MGELCVNITYEPGPNDLALEIEENNRTIVHFKLPLDDLKYCFSISIAKVCLLVENYQHTQTGQCGDIALEFKVLGKHLTVDIGHFTLGHNCQANAPVDDYLALDAPPTPIDSGGSDQV